MMLVIFGLIALSALKVVYLVSQPQHVNQLPHRACLRTPMFECSHCTAA